MRLIVDTRPIGPVGSPRVPLIGRCTRCPQLPRLIPNVSSKECGGRFQILLEKKTGKKAAAKTPEIDNDTRACIRNFRVDAIVRYSHIWSAWM